MRTTRNVQARGNGYLTSRDFITVGLSLDTSDVPDDAQVVVHHGEGQRGEPSWTVTATWTEETR